THARCVDEGWPHSISEDRKNRPLPAARFAGKTQRLPGELMSATIAADASYQLAAALAISPQAIQEARRRGLLSFVKHRNSSCWRLGDKSNGCFRRIDGKPFKIRNELAKATAETRGEAWHRLIGLDDVVENDRREILLILEGSKDGLAAFHFADAEDRLSTVGVVVALGSGIRLSLEDLEKFRGRRARIVADADPAGELAAARVGQQLASFADEVQAFNLAGLCRDDGF